MQVRVLKRGRDEEVVEVSPDDTVQDVCRIAGVPRSSAIFLGDKKLKLEDKVADTGVVADSTLREEEGSKVVRLWEELCGVLGVEPRDEHRKMEEATMKKKIRKYERCLPVCSPIPEEVLELLRYT
eukprot:Sspe_Gene.56666::Locus_31155_Transcript_1_4_Confidence_0.733_Length_789::g.56666::m.56666